MSQRRPILTRSRFAESGGDLRHYRGGHLPSINESQHETWDTADPLVHHIYEASIGSKASRVCLALLALGQRYAPISIDCAGSVIANETTALSVAGPQGSLSVEIFHDILGHAQQPQWKGNRSLACGQAGNYRPAELRSPRAQHRAWCRAEPGADLSLLASLSDDERHQTNDSHGGERHRHLSDNAHEISTTIQQLAGAEGFALQVLNGATVPRALCCTLSHRFRFGPVTYMLTFSYTPVFAERSLGTTPRVSNNGGDGLNRELREGGWEFKSR